MTEAVMRPQHLAVQSGSALSLCALLLLPGLCLLAEMSDTAAYLAFIFALIGLILFVRGSIAGFQKLTIVGIFGVLAAVHCCFGYLLAKPTTEILPQLGDIISYYPISFLVIAAGVLAAALGYRFALTLPASRINRWCSRFSVDERKLLNWARLLLVAGAALMVFMFVKIGYLPILSAAPGQARYITPALSDAFLRDEWFVSRASDMLFVALILTLSSAWWRHNKLDIVMSLIGCVAILMPLRRAPLITIVTVVVIMQVLRTGKIKKSYILVLCSLAILYGLTQLIFFNVFKEDVESSDIVASAGSAFPEVRDLGWILSLNKEPWYGVTFAQATLPVPSFLSDFSVRYSVREITSHLIGFEQRESGGLRLTLAGESYLNFGYAGIAVVCFLFGALAGYLDIAIQYMSRRKDLAGLFIVALAFAWLCFWIYLAGTQAAATVKIGIVISGALLFLAWNKQPTAPYVEVRSNP